MADVRKCVDIANVKEQMQYESDNYDPILLEDTEKWDITLKKEIINWGDYDIKVNELSSNYIKEDFNNLVKDKENEEYVKGIYYIKNSELKEKTYIYDKVYNMIYKIPVTRISKYKVHSVEELDYLQEGGEREKNKVNYTSILQNAEIRQVGSIKCYEPDLNNLAKEVTSLIFYKYDTENNTITSQEYIVSAEDWLNEGRPNKITEDGNTYILYDYENQIWANIRIITSSIETNWTWIPRYAYSISGTTTNVAFIDIEDNKLNGEEGEYTTLEAFAGNSRKGIWISKYEVTSKSTGNTSAYSYYIPDMTGLDKHNTYLEIYDDNAENFVDSIQLSTVDNLSKFAEENNWFDYYNQRWANIKIINKNGTSDISDDIETWWVWIPRYAYNNSGSATDIIFIDTTDKPIDGTNFSTSYTVPEAFKGNTKRGIWVSKYEVTAKSQVYAENIKSVPDVSNLLTAENSDQIKVYLEIYNETKTGFEKEVELSTISNLEQFAKENNWYDYSNKAWANIKIINNQGTSDTGDDIETWWVWIPRYAYNNMNTATDIILLDENNKTLSGADMPKSYTLAEVFKNNQKTGIWISKYEATEK